ncbi:MAG: hypothetical protein AB1522_00400 [Chloroflexota bacterium]
MTTASAKQEQVYPVRRVYICGNGKCANREASTLIYEKLRSLIEMHGLDNFDATYRVKCHLAGCLDICENGVTLVVQPDGIYYWKIDMQSIERIFHEHLLDNRPVEEFIYIPKTDSHVSYNYTSKD